VLGLKRYSSVVVTAEQHGDAPNADFVRDLPEDDRRVLVRALQDPKQVGASVVVCHSEPGAWVPARYQTTPCPPRGALYRVGRTMFESDRVPSGWAERLAAMDEVWVPTEFHRVIFTNASLGGIADASKVQVVGEPVDTDALDPAKHPVRRPLARFFGQQAVEEVGREEEFAFLSVFKWEYRKGWDVLLKAYARAFRATDPVRLYVLTSSYHGSSDFEEQIQRFYREQLGCAHWDTVSAAVLDRHGGGDGVHSSAVDDRLPRPSHFCVDFADGAPTVLNATRHGHAMARIAFRHLPPLTLLPRVPQRDLGAVYRSSDAFVLPSRGEGWGRPHVEAMSMALPVIATNWSGPTAFLSHTNGYPLRYTHLRPIPDGPFRGHLMAEPDEAHLVSLLRRAFEARAEAAHLGMRAREDMIRKFHPRVLAAEVQRHLQRISSALGSASEL
jgi:glycosyltransferase involved in cell wall biosynthesis